MDFLITFVLLISMFQAFVQSELTDDRTLDHKWKQFKATHRKVYKDTQEEARRKKIYQDNLKQIQTTLTASNGHKNLFSLAENALTDMTKEERNQLKQLKITKKQLSQLLQMKVSNKKGKMDHTKGKNGQYGQHRTKLHQHKEAHEKSHENCAKSESHEDDDDIDNDDDQYTEPTTPRTVPETVTTPQSAKFQEQSSTPDSVDNRNDACMPPIVNQGNCGSCYAFAAIACVEWAACQKSASKQLTLYSEQQLVDCSSSSGNLGCNGGHYLQVWAYMKKIPVLRESDYAYTSQRGACKRVKLQKKRKTAVKVSSYAVVPQYDEEALKEAVAKNGMVAVAVDASPSSFDFYSSGIYNERKCANAKSGDTRVDHAMALVGYGTEDNNDYWLVRNSWGTSWGMQGYMKLLRGNNTCNVAMIPAYPSLN